MKILNWYQFWPTFPGVQGKKAAKVLSGIEIHQKYFSVLVVHNIRIVQVLGRCGQQFCSMSGCWHPPVWDVQSKTACRMDCTSNTQNRELFHLWISIRFDDPPRRRSILTFAISCRESRICRKVCELIRLGTSMPCSLLILRGLVNWWKWKLGPGGRLPSFVSAKMAWDLAVCMRTVCFGEGYKIERCNRQLWRQGRVYPIRIDLISDWAMTSSIVVRYVGCYPWTSASHKGGG